MLFVNDPLSSTTAKNLNISSVLSCKAYLHMRVHCSAHIYMDIYAHTHMHTHLRVYVHIVQDSCRNDQYTCINGQCIAADDVCNFNNDCVDGSDEIPAACGMISYKVT